MKINYNIVRGLLWGALCGVFGCMTSCVKHDKATRLPGSDCKQTPLDYTRSAVLYEINTRQYSDEGTFEAVERDLPRLKDLGVDILWFMPIHPISVEGRKGTLGSYYAVQDYTAVNPEFGTERDFRRLVKTAHRMGFKVIIDWVGNHTGMDNAWVAAHPGWYVRENGKMVSPYDWTDVYKLDYTNPELRRAMIESMRHWVKTCDIDGFRCDAAIEVPVDFWEEARRALDADKRLFWLAEAWEPELTRGAFDMVYGWDFHATMNAIASGEKDASDIDRWLEKQADLYCNDTYVLQFITNHDENTWKGTEFERMPGGADKAMAVLTYTLPGMPLLYTGQEIGSHKRFEFFEKDALPHWVSNEYTAFYRTLNAIKHRHKALAAGHHAVPLRRFATSEDEHIYAFVREEGDDRLCVILNLSGEPVEANFIDDAPEGVWAAELTNAPDRPTLDFTADKTLHLGPWGYWVGSPQN